jgi:hypothetical protein
LRGGSFNNNANNARAAYRNNNVPGNRNNNNGFRLVVVRLSTPYLYAHEEWVRSLSSPDSCTLWPGLPVMAQRRASAPP